MSTIESIDRGVPIIGIPIFSDQPMNIRNAVHAGIGLRLDFDDITEDGLYTTIREVVDNPRWVFFRSCCHTLFQACNKEFKVWGVMELVLV